MLVAVGARRPARSTTAPTRLADFLEAHPDINLADVAHTLATGRRAIAHRRVVAATDVADAVAALRSNDRNRVATQVAAGRTAARGVHVPRRRLAVRRDGGRARRPLRRVPRGRCATASPACASARGVDLAPLLAPDADADALRQTTASLPAIFLTSVALARQWMAWGVQPTAFVGHSLGEYAAAHLAGVLTLDGALDLDRQPGPR